MSVPNLSPGLPLSGGLGWVARSLALASSIGCLQPAYAQTLLGLRADSPVTDTLSGLKITPRVSVSGTFTNNVASSSTNPQSDLVLEAGPGVRMSSNGARLKLYLDYELTGLLYVQGNGGNQFRNALDAFATVEAIENWGYVDVNAKISQQSISAFGQPALGNASSNSNQTEVATLRVSPYIKGNANGLFDYAARYSQSFSRSASDRASDIDSVEAVATLRSSRVSRGLGWSVDASHRAEDYSLGRSTRSDRLNGGVNYSLNREFALSADAEQQSDNYRSGLRQSISSQRYGVIWSPDADARLAVNHDTRGYTGFDINWAPTPRTKLTAMRALRSYGAVHSLAFEHRTRLTAISLRDSQDVASNVNRLVTASVGSLYDIYFSQFASIEPDPVKRAELTNAFLVANGLNPNAPVTSGFLASGLTDQRRQDLSFSLLGARTTLTLLANRSTSKDILFLSDSNSEFRNASLIRERGLSLTLSYRLTPLATVNGIVARQRVSGSLATQETELHQYIMSVTNRLTDRISGLVELRRNVFYSTTAPYNESSLMGKLIVQF